MQESTQKMHSTNFNTLTEIAKVLLEPSNETIGQLEQFRKIIKIMDDWATEFGDFANSITPKESQ